MLTFPARESPMRTTSAWLQSARFSPERCCCTNCIAFTLDKNSVSTMSTCFTGLFSSPPPGAPDGSWAKKSLSSKRRELRALMHFTPLVNPISPKRRFSSGSTIVPKRSAREPQARTSSTISASCSSVLTPPLSLTCGCAKPRNCTKSRERRSIPVLPVLSETTTMVFWPMSVGIPRSWLLLASMAMWMNLSCATRSCAGKACKATAGCGPQRS
mmetsp:Transcript_83351/g.178689  ORF Transcript_83351/g.178689 Transcript_83351/m.178689 type:complete len:214 (-) Transcript_83351:425-1066(-)